MTRLFPNVWYATPERAASLTKLVVFDDSGSLEVSPQECTFSGKREILDLDTCTVSLARQRLPWVTYALMNALLVPVLLLYVWSLLSAGLDLTSGWSLVGVAAVLGVMAAANGLGLLVGISTPWVLVEYKDEHGQVRRAYFADASGFGWGGIFGGTKRMYQALASSAGRQA
jgi:hypothetical protein